MSFRKFFAFITIMFISTTLFAEEPSKRIISLSEAIKIALKNSYTLKIQDERIEQARSLERKALSLLLPQISAQGTYTRYDKEVKMSLPEISSLELIPTPPYVKFGKYNNYVIQKENSFGALANLNLPLFNLPNYLAYLNSKDSEAISRLNKENQESELIYNVALAYLNCIGVKKGIGIAKNSIGLARSHLEVVEKKLKSGEANELTLIKARLELEKAENDLERTQKAYKIAIEGLRLLLNLEEEFDVEDSVQLGEEIAGDEAGLFNKAINNRIDMKILDENRKVLERDLNISKARFLPTLNMNATYRYSDITSFLGEETQWFIILSMNLSLYDGGMRFAELKEKRSRLRENELQIKQLMDSIRSQIRQSLEEIRVCRDNIASLERQLSIAKRSYELSEKSFEAGMIPQSDLIDSEIMVTNTELLLERERTDCQIQYIKLLRTTGEINRLKGR